MRNMIIRICLIGSVGFTQVACATEAANGGPVSFADSSQLIVRSGTNGLLDDGLPCKASYLLDGDKKIRGISITGQGRLNTDAGYWVATDLEVMDSEKFQKQLVRQSGLPDGKPGAVIELLDKSAWHQTEHITITISGDLMKPNSVDMFWDEQFEKQKTNQTEFSCWQMNEPRGH